MKFHIFVLLAAIILLNSFITASAQVDSVIGQVSSSDTSESYAGAISGDGRFIVFDSGGNIATHNPRNADGNREIFIFDYAQRQIFQITDTKSLLTDPATAPTNANTKVVILNVKPVISNQPDANGNYWIAFSSNATCSYPGNTAVTPQLPVIVSSTNPGNFNANSPPLEPATPPQTGLVNRCLITQGSSTVNNLTNDGNTEMWFYQLPVVPAVADLSAGDEIALTNLASGTFTQLTNTTASRLPVPGSSTVFPIIADDNTDVSIDDQGSAISFTSNRDLITGGNAAPDNNNEEIFVHVRGSAGFTQVTTTARGTITNPLYSLNSTITNLMTGNVNNGWRVMFLSNGNNPITGMTGNGNSDTNEEIFFTDLDQNGALTTNKKQLTTTTRTNPGDVVNILNPGRRMSRNGRYIAFDSYADLASEHSGANQGGFATFVCDAELATNNCQRVLPRSNADSGAFNGDIQRYPGFTNYDENRNPGLIVLETRMNIRASDGTVPTNADEGLNNITERPAQIYSTSPVFIPPPPPPPPAPPPPPPRPVTRLTKLPVPIAFLASVQPIPSNNVRRMTFNLAQTEIGTGNPDLLTEFYYYLLPVVETNSAAAFNYATGASRMAVSASPVPTPTPTATPTPTPTPSVTPTPTPTPQPPAVHGVSPGSLTILDYDSGLNQPVIARTAVGSLERRFTLPIELSGVTMTVNGAAVGLKSVGRRQIVFVVPPGLTAADAGTVYPVVVNNNGTVFKGNITLVPARPDIFTKLPVPGPGGRARVFNATNRVLTTEPFTIRTFQLRGSRLVPSILRIYLTGVNNLAAATFKIKIGSIEIPQTTPPATVLAGSKLFEPGVYTVDFTLPSNLAGAGDQPIFVEVTINGIVYRTRLDETAPRISIL